MQYMLLCVNEDYVCIMFNCVHLIHIIQKRLKVMENKLLEEKHQRKLLQDCTEQVIILYYDIVYNIMFIPTYHLRISTNLYGFNCKSTVIKQLRVYH